MKNFNKEKEIDELIKPLMNDLYKLCEKHGMPLLIDVIYAADDNNAQSYSSRFCPVGETPPDSHGIFHLIKDAMSKGVDPITAILSLFAQKMAIDSVSPSSLDN